MEAAWIGVIGALAGVAVGGMFEWLRGTAVFRRDRRFAALADRRRQLEMIYVALERVGEAYGQALGPLLLELGTGQALKRQPEGLKIPWAQLRMLVNLYRPFLLPYLDRVEVAGPRLGEAMGKAVMSWTGDTRRNVPLGERVLEEHKKLGAEITAMRDAIVAESRTIDQSEARLLGLRIPS